eukprot:6972211-Pyramimonas_sp.AAC.1
MPGPSWPSAAVSSASPSCIAAPSHRKTSLTRQSWRCAREPPRPWDASPRPGWRERPHCGCPCAAGRRCAPPTRPPASRGPSPCGPRRCRCR